MVHLGFLGSDDKHVPRWLAALGEQDLRVTYYSYTPARAPIPGVAVRALPLPSRRPADRVSWADFWGGAGRLRRVLEADGVDVLLASYATSYGLLGLRTGFRPLIVQTWTRDVSIYPFEGWKRHLLGPVVRRVLAGADRIVTDGEALAEVVRDRFPTTRGRVVGLRWGIRHRLFARDPEAGTTLRAEWGIPASAPLVVSARGVEPWYRPHVVLPALEAFLGERPDAHAVVLTLGHARTPEVAARLAALADHPRLHVVDRFLPLDTVRALWSAADVMVSVPEADGISESVLEGMAAGAVPVVSDIGSNRSFLAPEESALFVPGDAPADLTRTLHDALDRLPALRDSLVPRNQRWVAEHGSVEGTARVLADLARELAADASLRAAAREPRRWGRL